MAPQVVPALPGVVEVPSAPRPTPEPAKIPFAQVLAQGARGLVRGAESAMSVLPGGPLMAIAVRGASAPLGGAARTSVTSSLASPEGPGGQAAGAPPGSGSDGTLESSLSQAQEMNIYYLRVQEEVNAENRRFTALSNVLKAEHDTVKTAIGNIR